MQLTEAQIEQMRSIGLVLDRGGTFWHHGAPVTHARLRQALLRWLDVRGDGKNIVKLDERRYAYVDVEDAHLRALSAIWEGDRCIVTWDDDQAEELDYASLSQAPDHALYCRVRDRLRGRIAGPAYHAITERVVETDRGFALEARGRRWPIAS